MMQRLIEVCEELGFGFHLDLEGELEVVAPISVNVGDLTMALEAPCRAKELRDYVARRAKRLRHSCVGGPCNGQLHDGWGLGCAVLFHVGRAKWATYVVGDDGRAWWLGYASSEKKAREMVNRSEHQPVRRRATR